MLVVKRVCEELEEGRGSLRLRYKVFNGVLFIWKSEKVFDEFFFSKSKRKSFQRLLLKVFFTFEFEKGRKKKFSTVSSSSSSSSSSFEGHPLQARHKQDWGRGFILLLLQTAALPGSDAGSDVIKPASSIVIQNRQTSCSMWCPMYAAHC